MRRGRRGEAAVTQLLHVRVGDGSLVASCSLDWTVRLWDAAGCSAAQSADGWNTGGHGEPGACRAVLVGHAGGVHAACVLRLPNGQQQQQQLVTGAGDGSVAAWDLAAALQSPGGGLLAMVRAHDAPLCGLAPVGGGGGGGGALFSCSERRDVCLWRAGGVSWGGQARIASGQLEGARQQHTEAEEATWSPGSAPPCQEDDLWLSPVQRVCWDGGAGGAVVKQPHAVAVDASTGTVYVAGAAQSGAAPVLHVWQPRLPAAE